MQLAVRQTHIDVPQRVPRPRLAPQHADSGAQYEIAARGDLPGEYAAARRIVEGVLGEARGDGVLGAVQRRVAEIQRVGGGRCPAQRRLPSLEGDRKSTRLNSSHA